MFYYDSPTYLLKTSGPFTIFKFYSLIFSALANCLAISVLPVPGGPYRRIPFTCFTPNFSTTSFENLLEANVLLKILNSSLSNPPIPIFSGVKSGRNKELPSSDAATLESEADPGAGLAKTCPGAGIISIIVLGTSKPNYFYFPP